MSAWQSLRMRLVSSYIALALLLLTIAGYVFANALSFYAASVQQAQMIGYSKPVTRVLDDARGRSLTPEQTLAILRQNFPDLQVDQVKAPFSLRMTAPVPNMPGQAETLQPLPEQGTQLPDEKATLGPGQKVIVGHDFKGVLFHTQPPGESSFFMAFGMGPNAPDAVQFRFSVRPSAMTVLSGLYGQVIVVLAVALLLAGLVGWLLSRWLSRPLSQLGAATEAVAEGNFLQTVHRTGITEVDRVAEQFNRMALRLRDSFRSLAAERDKAERFAADAAHELKTPVTTLRAYYEVTEEHPERLPQVLPAVGRQVERMEQIISGLLQLASLDGGAGVTLQTADLGATLRRLEPLYQALTEESGHRLTTTLPDAPVPVALDEHLLELAVNNLMDNACKYTPPGGQVQLTLAVDEGEARITVQDTGKGIAAEELPYIFERFHRGVDTQATPGTGLGLAIAQAAIRRLGGSITAASEVGAGSRFVISLPMQ